MQSTKDFNFSYVEAFIVDYYEGGQKRGRFSGEILRPVFLKYE